MCATLQAYFEIEHNIDSDDNKWHLVSKVWCFRRPDSEKVHMTGGLKKSDGKTAGCGGKKRLVKVPEGSKIEPLEVVLAQTGGTSTPTA